MRWVERAPGTRGVNVSLSAPLFTVEGIDTAIFVTHAWHVQRVRAEAGGAGLVARPAAVRAERIPDGRPGDWMLRPVHVASWFALREWAGLPAQRMGF